VFLKKRHLETIRRIREVKDAEEIDKDVLIELRILGLVDVVDGRLRFTKAGGMLSKLIERLDLEKLPDVFVDTEIMKMLELAIETGWIPEEWMKMLEERQLAMDGRIVEAGREMLRIYRISHPNLFISQELLDFVSGMPRIGTFEELVAYKDTLGYGDNVINALQAMRILMISPKTEGKAFATTKTLDYILEMAKMIKRLERPMLIRGKEFRMLRAGESSEELVEMGLSDEEGTTELGSKVAETYKSLGEKEERPYPIYVLEDELKVLEAIAEVERINEHTPDVLPTYSEIKRRCEVEDLGEILHILESKEFIERRLVKEKDTYWLTDWGRKVMEHGTVTTDGMKALTFPLAGDVPTYEWVVRAKEEGLVKAGITKKGRFMLELTREIERKPYLTRYDVAILAKMRRGYVHREELVERVMELVGDERGIRKAIGEAEAKGFVTELQNHMIKLTKLGRIMKSVVEYAKTSELLSVKFGVTPTTFNVLKTIVENLDTFNKIWKEKSESRGYKIDEVEFLKKKLSLSEEEIKKSLIVLRNLGLLGKKSVTKAGRLLVRAYGGVGV